ncbi:MAG: ATP-binding cassette domain-containing protein [Chloroherpetonaceae bacterium]|nr:ATP-binding cassette domain-containing protein [Chthonomonadaceae bacterium]MDW8207446.1 ATP-binding cassette domain-containing protein [Chloroherpetonaceae bacterium]
MSVPQIQIHDLVYEVAGKRILNAINLEIARGEIVSIMGQSGSGKTTLLKLMCGLLRPTAGQILVEGEDITRMSEMQLDRVRLKMGLVFQYAALFDSLNVYDNIVFGVVRNRRGVTRRELDTLVRELLADVHLPGIERLFPSELSGGMRKRVGLARALAMQPTTLFYDEPTSGLDPVTAYAIDALIVETRRRFGVTSVVVSHHIPSIFRISDRIAMLDRGEIVAFGTPAELEASPQPAVQAFLHPDRSLLAVPGHAQDGAAK